MAEKISQKLSGDWQEVKLGDLADGNPLSFSIEDKKNRVLISNDSEGEKIITHVFAGSPALLRCDSATKIFAKADVSSADKPCELTISPQT